MSPALLLPLLLAAAPLPPQDAVPEPSCAAVKPAYPAEFAGWTTRVTLNAGGSTRSAPVIVVGRAAELRLVPVDRVTVTAPPPKPLESGATAGLALFQIAQAGTYRVALGSAAWIDVVRAGKSLPAGAHGHGPTCTGIRKIVDFNLTPGRYVLQLTGTQAPSMPVMIARAHKATA